MKMQIKSWEELLKIGEYNEIEDEILFEYDAFISDMKYLCGKIIDFNEEPYVYIDDFFIYPDWCNYIK